MRRALALATLLLAVTAGTASAESRLATVVSVTGTTSASMRFDAHPDPNYPDEKDACIVKHADVKYGFKLIKPGAVIELDYGYPASIRPVISTVRGRTDLRVTATESGVVRSLPGDLSTNVACGVETAGMDFNDPDLVPLSGMSPALCSDPPMRYRLRLQGRNLGSVEHSLVRGEDELLRCGWVTAVAFVPSVIGTAMGDWRAKEELIREGAPGTTVAITFPWSQNLDNECAGMGGQLIIDNCTLRQTGKVVLRIRLGS